MEGRLNQPGRKEEGGGKEEGAERTEEEEGEKRKGVCAVKYCGVFTIWRYRHVL